MGALYLFIFTGINITSWPIPGGGGSASMDASGGRRATQLSLSENEQHSSLCQKIWMFVEHQHLELAPGADSTNVDTSPVRRRGDVEQVPCPDLARLSSKVEQRQRQLLAMLCLDMTSAFKFKKSPSTPTASVVFSGLHAMLQEL
jgi:hypothetical protein